MSYEVDHRDIYDPNRVLTTAASFRRVSRDIDFPRNLRGKVVLDVGSGGSDTVAQLREREAIAFGVDIQYGNIPGLTIHLAQQLADPMAWVEGRDWQDMTLEQAEQMLGLNRPEPRGFAKWMINHTGSLTERMVLTHRKFLGDIATNPDHYIKATAEALPLNDNSVDFYFSIEAITAFMLGTRDVFLQVMEEAHRVVKPGGEIQLHPWISPNPTYWSEQQVYNGLEYMNQLRSSNIPFEIQKRGQLILMKVHP